MKPTRLMILFGALCLGGVLLLVGPVPADEEGEQEQEQERALTLEQLPEAVKATVLREAGEHELVEIEEVRIGERLFYEAEWRADGMEVEVQVGPDGTLLGREVEEPDDEEEEGDDDD